MCSALKALETIKQMDRVIITPAQAAAVIGCDPHYIRIMARENPSALGFPVTVVGRRTKIPRIPFIRHMEGVIS